MGERKMYMEYQVTYHDFTLNSVFSCGQLYLGEHNHITEIQCGLQQGPNILKCLFTKPTRASLLLSNPEL